MVKSRLRNEVLGRIRTWNRKQNDTRFVPHPFEILVSVVVKIKYSLHIMQFWSKLQPFLVRFQTDFWLCENGPYFDIHQPIAPVIDSNHFWPEWSLLLTKSTWCSTPSRWPWPQTSVSRGSARTRRMVNVLTRIESDLVPLWTNLDRAEL
jgi:hypothetical protein